jgi:hypothetical protein
MMKPKPGMKMYEARSSVLIKLKLFSYWIRLDGIES